MFEDWWKKWLDKVFISDNERGQWMSIFKDLAETAYNSGRRAAILDFMESIENNDQSLCDKEIT